MVAQHITVVPYNPAWPELARQEAALLREALGPNCWEVYHIGSTSVPGLAAKPILDLMPVVEDLSQVDSRAPALEALGYEYLGEFGIPGRRYLRKGGDERTHQAHVFQVDDQENIRRHLAVREYLRAHPQQAREYAALKERLAKRFPYDIAAYCDGKDAFVKALEGRALLWWKGEGQPL